MLGDEQRLLVLGQKRALLLDSLAARRGDTFPLLAALDAARGSPNAALGRLFDLQARHAKTPAAFTDGISVAVGGQGDIL